jgi:sec-independent protein translocase protein TatA
MLGNLTGWHLLILLAIVVLIFGAAKLPGLAKAVGQSTKILKAEMKTDAAPRVTTPVQPVVPPATASDPVDSPHEQQQP